MRDKAQMISTSFVGTDALTPEIASQVVTGLGELNVKRVIITDGEGKAVFDSYTRNSLLGRYVLLEEVSEALIGGDVVYSRYSDGMLISHAAQPIVLSGSPIGCVYFVEEDLDQGAIISGLETMIMQLSLGIEGVLLLFSLLFAFRSSKRMRIILDYMQKAREGEYNSKIRMHGSDEFGRMAREFNKLTDRLQDSEQAQRQFVSDASHELKTPLAAIKLLSDSILQNDMDKETMREFVADIGGEADRLTRMAQKLLTLSKADVMKSDHEVVDLTETIQKVFKMLVPMAGERQIRLTSSMEKGCTVVTMEDDMYQIVFNLVENAIKYNYDEGRVHVSLFLREDDVVLQVEDTGIGIPADAAEHIFERFYRVDKARSRQAGGSGLGLSIVRDLVERNYGHIQVQPGKEGGSCFTVVFPYFEVEAES